MPITGQMFWIAAPIFLLFVSLEIFCFHRNRLTGYSWRESLTTIGIGLGHKVSGLFCFSFIALAMSWIWDHRLFDITLNHIGWIALLFIAVEFNYYWYHRCSHTIRWRWDKFDLWRLSTLLASGMAWFSTCCDRINACL